MHRFTRWPLTHVNRRLAILLLLLFTATVGSVIYLSYTLVSVNNLIKQGSQAVEDALTLQDLYINIQGAEGAQRGYIITGDPSYLEPYDTALVVIPKDLAALAKQPDIGNSTSYKQLVQLTSQKLAELKQSTDLRRDQGEAAAAAVVNTGQGKALMDQIRLIIYQTSSSEFSAIIPREARSQHNLDWALAVGGALVVFVMAMCIVLIRFFQAAILRERAVEGAKNEFLSLASHQLRTPATNVRQYLGLVLEGYLGKLSKDQRDAIEVANRNNNTQISIINDLLNVAKLDLNKIHLQKTTVDLTELIRQVADDYHNVAKKKEQIIRIKYATKLATVEADETYLKSVLENLVDNACKYSPNKSKITIRARKLRSNSRDQVAIEVIDKGIGINKRDVSKLFKKFSRLPDAINSAEGTGLGLYWVKQIIELHGGKISIESSPGEGSIFRVILPA